MTTTRSSAKSTWRAKRRRAPGLERWRAQTPATARRSCCGANTSIGSGASRRPKPRLQTPASHDRTRLAAQLEAERGALSALQAQGVIGDDAFHRVEEELDWAELNVNAKSH
jgi:hypothetical protein